MRFLRDALRMSGLRRSSRVMDEMMARWRLITRSSMFGVGHLLLELAHARHHAHDAPDAAELLDLGELVRQVLKVEAPLAHLLGHLHGLLGVDRFRGLLDQRDDVAHAEDAVGDAGRVEVL